MVLSTYLVEDNRTIRDNLVPALEDLVGARVVGHAETEAEALEWITSHPGEWQLMIVDLFLREGSGLGVLRFARERGLHQRMVVLSNYVNSDVKTRCMALGADAVFDKSRELDAFFDYCNEFARTQA